MAGCLAWVITVFPAGPMYDVFDGTCDLVEINHCHDRETGQQKFVQVIAWDWSPEYQRFDAQQWAMASDWKRNDGHVVVDVADSDRILTIRCKHYRETWTNHDPERQHTKLVDEKYRRKVWQ